MILLDTTMLVYAVGVDHPLRDPARALFARIRDGDVRATTTLEALQEFAHVRARRRSRSDAAALAKAFGVSLSPLLRLEEVDLLEGLELFSSTSALGPFDAVLASAARRRDWAVASADRAFGDVAGLRALDPSDPSFIDQVRATR
ncbi:MAG TPA: type II toxin-antitoxin system VapC family toxin [Acidimicrobiales bacterium]|nr:type II toxin-antitoxin system VapC family toxin [Acidimicrobiales bacterium]